MAFLCDLCVLCGEDFDFDFRNLSEFGIGYITYRGTTLTPLPTGLRTIAALFGLCGAYLAILALITLASPGTISMTAAAPLLFGLELAGPYMFFLVAVAAGAIAWGLLRLNNIMRHAAILAACAGIVMLIPSVSGAVVAVRLKGLVLGGLGIIIRVIVAWYLSQADTAEMFKRQPTKP